MLPFHPIAELYPEPTPEEYRALVRDIKEQGQLTPGLVWHGEIVDGRQRAKACEELGIDFQYTDLPGDMPLSEVERKVRAAHTRRNLTPAQVAVIAARTIVRKKSGPRDGNTKLGRNGKQSSSIEDKSTGRTVEIASDIYGVSPATLSRVIRAAKYPDLEQSMFEGSMSAHAAEREAQRRDLPPPKPLPCPDAIKRFDEQHGTDFAERVETGDLAVSGAKSEMARLRFIEKERDDHPDLTAAVEEYRITPGEARNLMVLPPDEQQHELEKIHNKGRQCSQPVSGAPLTKTTKAMSEILHWAPMVRVLSQEKRDTIDMANETIRALRGMIRNLKGNER